MPKGHVRKLFRSERSALREHLLRLAPADRHMRFLGGASDDFIERYCQGADPLRTIVLGYFADGDLRGAGELVFDETMVWSKRCEVALSVEEPYRGRGVGTELSRRLLVIARNRGVGTIYLLYLAENKQIQAIARKLGAELEVQGGGIEGRIHPPWPSYLSLVEEAWADGLTVLRAVFERGDMVSSNV